jgi:hypothetical protein
MNQRIKPVYWKTACDINKKETKFHQRFYDNKMRKKSEILTNDLHIIPLVLNEHYM